MQIQLKVLSTVVNSRVLRSGDEAGKTKYSVDLYAHTGDRVPSKFVISGLSSEADAQVIAAKYPNDANVLVRYTPRDSMWLETSDIQLAAK